MDLWIRSQDRETIKKCCFIEMHELIENEDYILQDNEIDYGRYKTKERALEVLDEIEDRITLLNLMSTINGEKEMIKIAHAFGEDKINGVLKPYQMPKE
jgi:hypothetical protein